MTYAAYGENGYLGDVASIGGWEDFKRWASIHGGDEVERLIASGVTHNPRALAVQLGSRYAVDPDVNSVRGNLATLAGKAEDLLIIHDGSQ